MGKLRREVGFWGSLGRLHLRDLLTVEYGASLVVGVGSTLALMFLTPASVRVGIAGDYLAIAAALVGVVFGGMALVVALMSEAYMKLLAESESGITGFLSPFMIGLGTQVAAVLTAVGYRAFASVVPGVIEPWLFGLVTILFVASCLEVIVLARNVFMHARLRVKQQNVHELEAQRRRKAQ